MVARAKRWLRWGAAVRTIVKFGRGVSCKQVLDKTGMQALRVQLSESEVVIQTADGRNSRCSQGRCTQVIIGVASA